MTNKAIWGGNEIFIQSSFTHKGIRQRQGVLVHVPRNIRQTEI